MKTAVKISLVAAISIIGVSCTPGERGAVTGGLVGAGIGALAGNGTGALIGAVGAVAGSEISKNRAYRNRGYRQNY